jgi:hypothetical protein
MEFGRKAQVQAISMVLIAGIILTLAGTAYFWGKPMIEKRTTMTDVSTAESFMLELDRQITEVARSGGSKAVSIPRIPGASVKVNESGNEILLRFLTSQQMLGMGEDSMSVPVETYDTDLVGTYGGSPRIILLEGEPVENDQFLMTLRLHYRPLETRSDPYKGYRIEIVDGGTNSMGAPSRVTVSYLETTTAPGQCCGTPPSGAGDRLDTKINVSVA